MAVSRSNMAKKISLSYNSHNFLGQGFFWGITESKILGFNAFFEKS